MGLQRKVDDLVEMIVINMGKDAKHLAIDVFQHPQELRWEGHALRGGEE